jgi:hypothetical protein
MRSPFVVYGAIAFIAYTAGKICDSVSRGFRKDVFLLPSGGVYVME